MTKELETHITTIALHLSKLQDQENIPGSPEGDYIGEISSVTANFALNGIPTMTIILPHGARVHDQSFINAPAQMTKLRDIIKNREGVGVYLDVSGIDNMPGLEEGSNCLCLFKGYILETAVQNSNEGGSSTFGIVHWLTDLANIAIVNRLSSPDNPMDISNNAAFGMYPFENQVEDMWSNCNAYTKSLSEDGKTIFDAIKDGLTYAMNEDARLSNLEPGYLTEKLYKKATTALNALKSASLDLNNKTFDMSEKLKFAISDALSREQMDMYFSVTLWQKIVQGFLPQFYMTLTPLVDHANIIPQPGIQISDDVCTEISDNMILSVSTRTKHGKTLGSVFLSTKTPLYGAEMWSAQQASITKFQYPSPDDTTNPPTGVMKACALPLWLENYNDMTVMLSQEVRNAYSNCKFAEEDAGDAPALAPEEEDAFRQLCNTFVKTVYHAEVTRGNTATINCVLNLQIPPGTPVKLKVPHDKILPLRDQWLYGIVEKVQYTISNTTVTTIFSLSDLRVGEDVMKQLKLDDALLYEKAWTGDENLYVVNKEIDGEQRIEKAKCH